MNMSGSSGNTNGCSNGWARRTEEKVLSVTRGLVVRVEQDVQQGSELLPSVFIEKRFPVSTEEYTATDQRRFLRELSVLKALKDAKTAPMVPRLLGATSSKETPDGTIRFRLEYRQGAVMSDVYAGMSEDALMLEKELLGSQEFPNFDCYRQGSVMELHQYGRLDQTPKGVRLKPSIRELHEERGCLFDSDAERSNDFLRIFCMGLDFQDVATQTLNMNKGLFRYGKREYLADFENALRSINESRSVPCHDSTLKNISRLFKEIYLPQILDAPEVMIHGDFTPFNVLINWREFEGTRYALLDMGHVSKGNPFFDAANYVTFCRLFCGMSQADEADEIWNLAFDKYDVKNRGLRTVVENTRNLEVLGILSTRLRATNMFTPEDLSAMRFRRKAYTNALNCGLKAVYDDAPVNAKEKINAFNGLVKTVCQYS
ncbi:phosphotransferase [Candidatus Woesearchaeota archaeon]|jgi:hypothetical protein|nr:phosphotransferase [Candidatus Woesearchaeota archaeon]MBT4368343.1 phosphotransferase [Candidatus Woesearchaeota archaeon]MBT4712832.1 phosphotransferase [Candidatus Woesearchaeota archaeon]MBT6639744.1 phosphotransferase [Candidatus Woesearchaeota archaeon]MBT7133916.1 phosphotransferase [Candidatus Woesearchaeota archaeon]